MEHIHHHHDHTHEHGEPFAPAAENLLLDIAMQVRDGTLRANDLPQLDDIAKLQEQYDIANIKARLGDAYPDLGILDEATAILEFARQAEALPTSHARYDHSHGDGDGCGKTHGPVRRTLDTIEQKVLGRIRNERAKLLAAAAFRGSSLILCPGDDLAAIGLQLYGAFTGHTGHDNHEHAEHKAILPGRPRVDFAKGTAVISSLPLNVALQHKEIPDTPAGNMWKERTSDPEPPTTETMPLKPERKPRRFRRLAMLGAAAIALVGGGFAVAATAHDSPKNIPRMPAVAPPVMPKDVTPQERLKPDASIMQTERAQKGDSQWGMIEDEVQDTLGRDGRTPLINVLTHMSVHANKSEVIKPGQEVRIPTREVIIKIDRAIQNPQKAEPRLVADLRIINDQAHFGSATSIAAIERMQSYAF